MTCPSFELKQPLHRVLDDRLFLLEEDCIFQWEHQGRCFRIVAKKGATWDGASVPQVFWFTGIWPHGLILLASLFHDLLYDCVGVVDLHPLLEIWEHQDGKWVQLEDVAVSRENADRLFARILKVVGYGSKVKLRRNAAFFAVRLFGFFGWRRRTKDKHGDIGMTYR